MRNPKKQALGTKLETRACYLTIRRIDEKRNESGNHWVGTVKLGFRRGNTAWISGALW